MSLNSPILSRHSAAVTASFGARAATYELYAEMQRAIAARLAGLLPDATRPRVLELGCGTGLFSRHLVARYSARQLRADRCGAGDGGEVPGEPGRRASLEDQFRNHGCEAARRRGAYDVIVLSMTLHWLADPDGEPRAAPPVAGAVRCADLCGAWACELRRVARRIGGRGVVEWAPRHPAPAGHCRRGAAFPGCGRALVSAQHEIGRRPDARATAIGRCRLARFAAPSAPQTQKAAVSPGTSSTAGSPPRLTEAPKWRGEDSRLAMPKR